MLPATLYTASICVVCLVHEKEKTDLQCDMSFDAGIRHLNQIIERNVRIFFLAAKGAAQEALICGVLANVEIHLSPFKCQLFQFNYCSLGSTLVYSVCIHVL